jgi:hypothetical protein
MAIPNDSRPPERSWSVAACLATRAAFWRYGRIAIAVISSIDLRDGGRGAERDERLVVWEGEAVHRGQTVEACRLRPPRPVRELLPAHALDGGGEPNPDLQLVSPS